MKCLWAQLQFCSILELTWKKWIIHFSCHHSKIDNLSTELSKFFPQFLCQVPKGTTSSIYPCQGPALAPQQPQGHQPLLHRGHSKAWLQLPTALPCLAMASQQLGPPTGPCPALAPGRCLVPGLLGASSALLLVGCWDGSCLRALPVSPGNTPCFWPRGPAGPLGVSMFCALISVMLPIIHMCVCIYIYIMTKITLKFILLSLL